MIYRIHLPDGTYSTIVADQAFIDAHFPDAELLPEPVPVQASVVPQSVSRAQGKLALIQAGLWPRPLRSSTASPTLFKKRTPKWRCTTRRNGGVIAPSSHPLLPLSD